MSTQDDDIPDDIPGVWRDEKRLPLSELVPAVATSAEDGQDDNRDTDQPDPTPDVSRNGDPDPDSEAGRSLRPDFTGPSGPN
jgi:hypothetical protein